MLKRTQWFGKIRIRYPLPLHHLSECIINLLERVWCDSGSGPLEDQSPSASVGAAERSSDVSSSASGPPHSSGSWWTPWPPPAALGAGKWWRWSLQRRNAPCPPGRWCWRCSRPHSQMLCLKIKPPMRSCCMFVKDFLSLVRLTKGTRDDIHFVHDSIPFSNPSSSGPIQANSMYLIHECNGTKLMGNVTHLLKWANSSCRGHSIKNKVYFNLIPCIYLNLMQQCTHLLPIEYVRELCTYHPWNALSQRQQSLEWKGQISLAAPSGGWHHYDGRQTSWLRCFLFPESLRHGCQRLSIFHNLAE